MDNKELNRNYKKTLSEFRKASLNSVKVSKNVTGYYVDTRRGYSTVLYTRLCVCALSLVRVAPNPRKNKEHWDFGAVSSITRNLIECYLIFFYLCIEPIDEDEWLSRLNLMHLHDCTSRIKMFTHWIPDIEQMDGLKKQSEELKDRLLKRKYFKALSEKQQKHYLKGQHSSFLTQDEILKRMGKSPEDITEFRTFYEFYSAETHSLPLSFYRMGIDSRGTGVENNTDKAYITMALDNAEKIVSQATKELIDLFPEIDLKSKISKKFRFINKIKNRTKKRKFKFDLNYKWEVIIEDKAALMSIDIPYYRENQKLLEYLTLVVAKDQSEKRPGFISVGVPDNIAHQNGVFISFGKTTKDINGNFTIELQKEEPVRAGFRFCGSGDCFIQIQDGYLQNEDNGEAIDIFQKFLEYDHVYFLLTYNDSTHKSVSVPLFSFKEQYKNLFKE